MKRASNFVFKLTIVFLALSSALGIYFWSSKDMRYFSVRSDSMRPTLLRGDLVIDEKTALSKLEPGQVISYVSPADPRLVITHRLVNVDLAKDVVITQGDNLSRTDPPVPSGSIQGRSIFVLPAIGYIFDTLRNPLGLIVLIYLPVIALGIIEFRKLAGRYGRPYKI